MPSSSSCMSEDSAYNEIIVESPSSPRLYIRSTTVKAEERCLRQLSAHMFCRVGQGDSNDRRGDVFAPFASILEKAEMPAHFGQPEQSHKKPKPDIQTVFQKSDF